MRAAEERSALVVDALIITAVPEEYEAVLAIETGALAGSAWTTHKASTGLRLGKKPTRTPRRKERLSSPRDG